MTENDLQPAPAAAATARSKSGPRGRVIVFGSWCKGCRLCVDFCPKHVLALDENDHPYPANPEACNACRWCETHCPDLAIVVKPVQ